MKGTHGCRPAATWLYVIARYIGPLQLVISSAKYLGPFVCPCHMLCRATKLVKRKGRRQMQGCQGPCFKSSQQQTVQGHEQAARVARGTPYASASSCKWSAKQPTVSRAGVLICHVPTNMCGQRSPRNGPCAQLPPRGRISCMHRHGARTRLPATTCVLQHQKRC